MSEVDSEIRAWAAALVADWPPLSTDQIDLLRRTYGRVQVEPTAT